MNGHGPNGHGVGAVNGVSSGPGLANGWPAANLPNGAPANGAPSNGTPVNGAPANGNRVNGAPANGAAPNGAAANGSAPAPNGPAKAPEIPHADATRISEALSGPNGNAAAAAQQAATQQAATQQARPQPEQQRRPAAPGRPAAPDPDLEATTQHAPVPAAPQDSRAMASANGAAPARPQQADGGPATQQWNAFAEPAADEDETSLALPQVAPDEEGDLDYDDDFEYEDDLDYEVGDESEEAKIDATLARFSAVHDEIANEEAERRRKFSWLFGMKREPELGRDIPFDFAEGRDAQESRMQWKKQERKQRTKRVAIGASIAVALLVILLALVL